MNLNEEKLVPYIGNIQNDACNACKYTSKCYMALHEGICIANNGEYYAPDLKLENYSYITKILKKYKIK